MDERGFSVTMLRDLARYAVGRSLALKKGLPEVALCTFMLFFLYTYLFAGNVMVSSQQSILLKCAGARAQQGGQATVAITSINRTAAYNPSQWNLVGSTTYVDGSVSDLAANDSSSVVFSSYNSGATNTTFNYFPNNTFSDVDGNGNLGTQSNFTALSHGPDGIIDTLSEGITGGSNEQWLLPTGYQDPSSAWTSETLAYDNNTATASYSSIDAGSWSGFLVLNTSAVTCGKIQYYVDHSDSHINENQIDIYNGAWVNIYDGNGPWSKWSNVSFASTSVTQMRIRFYNSAHSNPNEAYIYEAQFLQSAIPQNYQLDLEAQWTGVNYTMANEWLCIYGGTMSTENLLVDAWNGSGWSNVVANLHSGWNNVSVSSYVASSTFTIRFRDATPNDTTQNSWQVDVCLLQAWTTINQYTAEVDFAGSSDLNSWTSLAWLTDSSWNTGSVNVTIQVYNYTLGGYAPSGTGYVNYISSTTASTDEGKTQAETSNPTSFRDAVGYWKIKIKGVKSATQFQMKVDWIQFQDTVTVLDRPPVALFTESARTVNTGVFVQFDASASYDPDGTITSYNWNFGDGQNGVGRVASHAYANQGNYSVTLTVTDNDGSMNTTQNAVTALDRPPIAQFSKSASVVNTGIFIQFDASASYDPDGTITSYNWNFGDGSNATGMVTSHSYVEDGTYMVALTVKDNDGQIGSHFDTVLVHNRAPIASFIASSVTVYTNDVVIFNATASYDSDGTIVNYSWDFGDGNHGAGSVVSHLYSENGTYTVTLSVTDDDGANDSAIATETVLNRAGTNLAPIASFTVSSQTVYTGEIITFDASASYDPDGTITQYQWNFGDNFTAKGKTSTHEYAHNGLYLIMLTVTGNDGLMNATAAYESILNRAPIANFTTSPTTVYTDQIITFNATASYDPDGTIVSYSWDFADGTNATGSIVTHAYDQNGTYAVKLVVIDNEGATDFAIDTQNVLNHSGPNQPPIANFSLSAQTVYTGEPISFNASASHDPDGTITSYYWNFGDNSTTEGSTVDHTYSEDGNFLVNLTVIDNDGATASFNTTVTVLNRPPVALFTESGVVAQSGEVIYFNGSMSYDQDGNVTSYFWDFGDQTNATGLTVNHAYSQPGNYTVILTVTDDVGASNATRVNVTIIDVFPVASFTTLPSQPKPGDIITFNAESSYDPNGTILDYRWAFGDGNITETNTAIVTHTYLGHGNFNVTLTVFDDKNRNDSTSMILSVQVHNVAVINVALSATEVQIGQTLNITVKVTNNGTAPEFFSVTVFANETMIANQSVTLLPPGADQVLVFCWNTSSIANAARYLIQADASNVTGESELADNMYNGGMVNIVQAQNNGSSPKPGFDWAWAMPAFLSFAVPFGVVVWKRRKRDKNSRDFGYFDEITGGGIPDSFSVLVIGGPGSGKSILCQELAHAFLAKEKTCLYVTYDCFPSEVRDNLKKFNQDVSTYEAKKSFQFLDCYSSIAKIESKEEYTLGQPFSLGDLGITLSETMGEMRKSPRVILDSIVPILTHVDPLKVIEFLQDRSARVKGVNGTLVFSVGKETIESSLTNRLEEIVDCIIELDVSEKKGKTVRNLHIKKMSGRKTSDKWIQFEIDPAKGIVFPI